MILFHFDFGLIAILDEITKLPSQLAIAIGLMGILASIYHPVSIVMLLKNNKKIGFQLEVNGVLGNICVAPAPIFTGMILTLGNWQLSLILPGFIC